MQWTSVCRWLGHGIAEMLDCSSGRNEERELPTRFVFSQSARELCWQTRMVSLHSVSPTLPLSHYLCMCLCAHMDLSVLAIQNGMHFTKNCAFPVKMTTTTRLLTTPAACLCAPRSVPLAISLSGAASLALSLLLPLSSFPLYCSPLSHSPALPLCRSLLTLFCLLARWSPLRLWGFSSWHVCECVCVSVCVLVCVYVRVWKTFLQL